MQLQLRPLALRCTDSLSPRRWMLAAALASLNATAAIAQLGDTPEVNDHLGSALVTGDFNGDGLADLVIGVPNESVESTGFPVSTTYFGAGIAYVLYGTLNGPAENIGPPGGLSTAARQVLRQVVVAPPQLGIGQQNAFGTALARGDFNHDGFDDLAVGIPGQTVNGSPGAGAVIVYYGSFKGLVFGSGQTWSQDSTGVLDVAEPNDAFGSALASGDFDGDGFADLAIGVPNEGTLTAFSAGAVQILRGSATGLTASGNQIWMQGKGVGDTPENGDHFGQALATGDFNHDGFADLAIGVPNESTAAGVNVGVVHVLYGTASGIGAIGAQIWHQDSPNIQGVEEANDTFGSALATGDFNGDGFADLAIGVPNDNVNGVRGGAVNLIYGSATGLGSNGNVQIFQGLGIILGQVEDGDRFGAALTTWRLNAGAPLELAVGIPGDSNGGPARAGAIEMVSFNSAGQPGGSLLPTFIFFTPAANDGLGSAIATGDFNGDGFADFAVGIPFRDVHANADAGQVHVTYPTLIKADLWQQGP